MFKKVAPLLTVIPMISLLCACGGPPAGNNIVVKTDGGKSEVNISSNGTASYPSTIPVEQYPNSKITMNVTSNQQATSTSTNMVSLSTTDPVSSVASFYQGKLTGGGWTIDQNMNMNGITMLTASKGGKKCMIQVMQDNNNPGSGTSIIITGD